MKFMQTKIFFHTTVLHNSTILLGLYTHFSPWRIIDDCGGAFAMGAIGGSVFHSIKGFRNAPSVSERNRITKKVLSFFELI